MPSLDRSILDLGQLDPRVATFAVDVVNRVIELAIERDASDVHLQPRPEGWDLLFRIDGVLSFERSIKGGGDSDPVKRLMVMAGLPTYRSSQPMEGRLNVDADEMTAKNVSLRLGIYPTIHGPRAVIRLLRKSDSFDSLSSLAMTEDVTRGLQQLCEQTDGAVLLAGPAGSGKTTTLYAMLRYIAGVVPRRSVVTIEDPVESIIPSISQSELDPGGGMTLASALRSAVRQDSEVLLVSEIRDPETAEAALQASLTGHLVFSSLHATDVPASLRRLVQLGIPDYVLRSGIRAIVSQRLIRRLCPDCSQTESTAEEQFRSLTPCATCLGTGYKGQIAIATAVRFDGTDPVGEAMSDALASGGSAGQMRRLAAEAGGVDLHQRAAECIANGLTDAPEVYRVLGAPQSFTD